MRILVVFLLLSTPFFQLRSQDYKKADFEPVISLPVPNMVFPKFKGGKKALDQYLKDNVIVPDSLQKINNEGVIVMRYRVNTNGQITEVTTDKINTTLSESFHKLVLEVMKKAGPWQPGLKNGKPFSAKLEISFNFDKK